MGKGSQEAAPGLDKGHGKSPMLLLATRRWLARLEGVGPGVADWKAIR